MPLITLLTEFAPLLAQTLAAGLEELGLDSARSLGGEDGFQRPGKGLYIDKSPLPQPAERSPEERANEEAATAKQQALREELRQQIAALPDKKAAVDFLRQTHGDRERQLASRVAIEEKYGKEIARDIINRASSPEDPQWTDKQWAPSPTPKKLLDQSRNEALGKLNEKISATEDQTSSGQQEFNPMAYLADVAAGRVYEHHLQKAIHEDPDYQGSHQQEMDLIRTSRSKLPEGKQLHPEQLSYLRIRDPRLKEPESHKKLMELRFFTGKAIEAALRLLGKTEVIIGQDIFFSGKLSLENLRKLTTTALNLGETRQTSAAEDKGNKKEAGSHDQTVKNPLEEVVETAKESPTVPIPHQANMERALGVSLAGVEAHAGPEAQAATHQAGAETLAAGAHIILGQSASPGQIAHEVVHLAQGAAGLLADGMTRDDEHERDAAQIAAAVEGGGQVDLVARFKLTTKTLASLLSGSPKFVRGYESGEHARLGCGKNYPYPNASGPTVTLPNSSKAYQGELVAFGDFYTSMDHIRRMPREETEGLVGLCRIEAVWDLARRMKQEGTHNDTPSWKEDPKRLDVLASSGSLTEEDWAKKPEGQSQTLGELRDEIVREFSASWKLFGVSFDPQSPPPSDLMAILLTIGRRRFRGENDSLLDPNDPKSKTHDPANMGGDYLDMAQNNLKHFTPNNWVAWQEEHRAACEDYAKAKSEQEKQAALLRDALACHYLTDHLSSGHRVNKEELMATGTQMLLSMAHQHKIPGKDNQEVLSHTLGMALQECFKDPEVGAAWDQGVNNAFANQLISKTEAIALQKLPKTGKHISVPKQLGDVIMGMPWRKTDNVIHLDEGADSHGPDSQPKGRGDYQLGAGNLAALLVHDCLNSIGYTVTNGREETWRLQGDGHLTAETQRIGHEAVNLSQFQVRYGHANPGEVRELMPRVAQIDPQSIRDFFAGFGGQFDQGKIDWLCNYVEGRKIPLSSEGPQDGAQASAAISKEMTAICHQLMQILFVPDREEGAKSETGLNISMLKAFLKKRLPEMVPASNAVNSVSDLDKKTPMGAVNAVEAYEPREASGKILPTAARDFHWSGTRLDFQVDVTNVEPGSYTMLGIVKDQQLGRDVGDAGEPIVGALPFKATDPEVGRVPFTIEVPETSKSEGASGGRRYVSASLELPNRDLGQWVQDMEGDGDARYVVISADIGGNMHIAASQRRNLRRKK